MISDPSEFPGTVCGQEKSPRALNLKGFFDVPGLPGNVLGLSGWWRGGGSNSRPSHCERDALPAELPPQRLRSLAEPRRAGGEQRPRVGPSSPGGARSPMMMALKHLHRSPHDPLDPRGSTPSTTTGPVCRTIRACSSGGPRRRSRASDSRAGSSAPTARRRRGARCVSARPTPRRCWSSSTAASGAPSTSRSFVRGAGFRGRRGGGGRAELCLARGQDRADRVADDAGGRVGVSPRGVLWRRPRRIVLAGHSAGGHLAAMMLAADGRRSGRVARRLLAGGPRSPACTTWSRSARRLSWPTCGSRPPRRGA